MIDFPGNDFWDFSIGVYASKEVQEACLGLQERHGADVNIVLFGLWVAASGRGVLMGSELDAALAASEAWHEHVVRPLRRVRRWLKGRRTAPPHALGEPFRGAVAALEIDAEHVEQLALAESMKRAASDAAPFARARDGALNVAAYLDLLRAEASDLDRAALGALLRAAFPEVPAAALDELIPRISLAGDLES